MKKQFTILLILVFTLGLIPVNFSFAITQDKINAEVQIVCPDNYGNWFSGSGTIIDSRGIILTNKHVVTDQYGGIIKTCFIGFIESISQEPDFGTKGNYNLADVNYYTTTDDMDTAILYLDNTTNKIYPYVNIWDSNSSTLQFGDKIEAIGFPTIGGSTITYTSGDFSGFGSISDGTQNYIKSTAQLEHGNSGGASYNSKGQFIGIPTMVAAGTLNSLSYLLSVNSIKNWLSGILGSSYKQEVIKQEPIVETPTVNIQNDITPPIEPSGMHVSCYTDSTKSSYISLGGSYLDFNKSQSAISTIYCEWTNLIDASGIAGYYVYFGQNINARPITGGVFSVQPNIQQTFNSKGIYHFFIQAKDNAGNISEPIYFGAYHYLMLEEDLKISEEIKKEVNQSKVNNFYIYDYSNGDKGVLLKKFQFDSSKAQKVEVPSNNLLIEWDLITNSSFDTKYNIRFEKGYAMDACDRDDPEWVKCVDKEEIKQYKVLKNSSYTITNLKVGNTYNFELGFLYSFGDKSGHYKAFYLIPTKQKKFNAPSISNGLNGKILLQVESHGEAWYVNPKDSKKYYMANGNEAFKIMRNFGVGIKNIDLEKIKTNKIFAKKYSGKIFLQVEAKGEAYYIDFSGVAHYLKDGSAAFSIMRELGLGITNNDLSKIPEGSL